jgi:hypothetical protein
VKRDPPIPKDGRCVVCGGERKIPKGIWARAEALIDPFCSGTCAREFHGQQLPVADPGSGNTSISGHGLAEYRKGCHCDVCTKAARDKRARQKRREAA